MGRGLGGIALTDGRPNVFINPAGLSRIGRGTTMLGYSMLRTELTELPPVRWDTNRDGLITADDPPLNVSTDYGRYDGIPLAIGRSIGSRFGIALNAFIPVDRLIDISTFDPSIPTWFMYENRQRRFELGVGIGWEQLPGLYLGGTIQALTRARFSLNGTLSASVSGADAQDTQATDLINGVVLDIHEMSLDLEPELSPMMGMIWDVGELIPPLEGLQLGSTWRGPVKMLVDIEVDLQIDATVAEVGDLEETTLAALAPFTMVVVDHYLPAQWGFGVAWVQPGDWLRLYTDARYTRWDVMPVNILTAAGELILPFASDTEIPLRDGNGHDLVLRPTWSTRLGGEVVLPRLIISDWFGTVQPTLRAGWSYEPTPLQSIGPNIALLDTDRMVFTGGLGIEHGAPFELVSGPVYWDAFFQYHPLAAGEIPVSYDDEMTPGAPIGTDRLPVGGYLWSTGVQWRMVY